MCGRSVRFVGAAGGRLDRGRQKNDDYRHQFVLDTVGELSSASAAWQAQRLLHADAPTCVEYRHNQGCAVLAVSKSTRSRVNCALLKTLSAVLPMKPSSRAKVPRSASQPIRYRDQSDDLDLAGAQCTMAIAAASLGLDVQ